MHEISLIQNLLESILREIEINQYSGTAIKGLALSLGALELHSEQAFCQAFDVESKGTALEGVSLELTIIPAKVECSACGFEGPLDSDKSDPHIPDLVVQCPGCGAPAPMKGGRGVQKIELIMDT